MPQPGGTTPIRLTILIPVFNDWTAVQQLAGQLDGVLGIRELSGRLVLVDDGSTERPAEPFLEVPLKNLESIQVLELKRNLGHQRALCVGLVHLYQAYPDDPVLIMDADGEDGPADIPLLLKEYVDQGRNKVIFAARGRRAEGIIFKLFYQLYRTIHRILVGFDIRFGNFSVLPPQALEQLAVSPDLWNHYAAAVVKTRMPRGSVSIDRSRRIAGQSKMGLVSLIVHGLSAMSVFGDVIGVRLLIISAIFGVLAIALILVVVAIRFATNLAIPGWATFAVGLLLTLLSQSVLLQLIFTFVVLYSRGQSSFIPLRDCPLYIREERTVFRRYG
jgi:glycosyltransferase involved in cell wall biosynthesis